MAAPPEPLDLAVFTRDRTESCAEAVSGFAAALGPSSKSRISIFDDSSEPGQRERLRNGLRKISADKGVAFFYAGQEEKNSFLSRLQAVLQRQGSTSSFGLLPNTDENAIGEITTGANCNALLLHHIGQSVLLLADDQRACFCRLGKDAEAEASITDSPDPTTFWRYRTREEALAAHELADIDIVAEYQAALQRRGQARTRVAMSGMWGDCGMSSSAYLGLCRLGNAEHVATHYQDIVDSRDR